MGVRECSRVDRELRERLFSRRAIESMVNLFAPERQIGVIVATGDQATRDTLRGWAPARIGIKPTNVFTNAEGT